MKWKVLWRKQDFGISSKNKALQERGALPRDEGDAIGECKAMHEENFLSSWVREFEKNKEGGTVERNRAAKEEVSKRKKREDAKEENETVVVERRCVNSVSAEAFDIFLVRRSFRSVVGIRGVTFLEDRCGLTVSLMLCG